MRGYRSIVRHTFRRQPRYSVLCAIDINGIVAYTVIEGSADGHTLFDFVFYHLIGQLNPFPNPRSVFVMDNARIHYYKPFIALFKLIGVRVITLPAYSPFLNPIELLFNRLKADLKSLNEFCEKNVFLTTMFCLARLRNESQATAFAHCGYQ